MGAVVATAPITGGEEAHSKRHGVTRRNPTLRGHLTCRQGVTPLKVEATGRRATPAQQRQADGQHVFNQPSTTAKHMSK